MKLILGLVFAVLGLLLVALLAFCVNRLDGQEVMDLPIFSHIDYLQEGMRKAIVASPTNETWVVKLETWTNQNSGVIDFGVRVLSRTYTNDKVIPNWITSNVVARIVWKGRTSECVLERNP